MKLLVTGGAGYVGSVVAAKLIEAGHEVDVLDNLAYGHEAAVPPEAKLFAVDLLDRDELDAVLSEGFDGVLHFAALACLPESVRYPQRYWRTNVCGTLNLLDAMRAADVKRLVFSSTCAVYGETNQVPISESVPPSPTNPYAASKLAVDQMLSHESAANQLAAVSLRYFNVAGASGRYGEWHQPESHIIPILLEVAAQKRDYVEIFGNDYPTPDGTAIRDYIHIEDLAEAHILALEAIRPAQHQIFNLGNGNGFSVREVLETAREITGATIDAVDSPRRPGDTAILVAASEKIRRELGWKPKKPQLSEMIADAWQWMQAHPNGYLDVDVSRR